MRLSRSGRVASAAAVLAFVAACADQPTSPRAVEPSLEVNESAGDGILRICKIGNAVASFDFNWSTVDVDGNPVASGTQAISTTADGAAHCVDVYTTSEREVATVTEGATPADWSLTDIAAPAGPQPPFAGGNPIVDLPTATASRLALANDWNSEVTFTNTYTPPPPPPGCTYTQGYWKTHSLAGPAPYDPTWALLPGGLEQNTSFFLSGRTYLGVFNTAPAGNSYYQLAHQYMAAELNILGGADPTAAAAAMAAAKTIFLTYTPAQIGALAKNSALRAQIIALAGTLDEYNNGLIGPGHCSE